MREDLIKAKVVRLTRKIEKDLPDEQGLHAASKKLRTILEAIGNKLDEKD